MKNTLRLCLAAALGAACVPLTRATPGVPGPAPATAFAVAVRDDWTIQGGLPANSLILSIQGLANTDAPRLYIDYPASWHFHDFQPVKKFYTDKYGMKFTQLEGPEGVLKALGSYAKGYVVWDTKVRTSLDVAFTAAGVLRAAVVDADLIPLAEANGLHKLADFRGLFEGQTDTQIFQWAYDKYWKDCSRDFLVWMGGVGGDSMEPGVADLAIAMHAFVADLSADPKDASEFAFHKRILAQMKPLSFIYGWHSYPKDTEGQWVTLTSGYGLKVIGLNTFPNGTFLSQIDFSPGFRFHNNNHVTREQTLVAKDKVYITLEQSDAMGIGAWVEPTRGQIPYDWDVGIDGIRWYPAIIEMFAQDMKPNDYFVGGQSGYMYPVAIPADRFPGLMEEMQRGMRQCDEHVVGIMDHTRRGSPVPIGYFDLPKRTVDEYYRYAPDVIGFVNGYAAAHTYDLRNGQAFMSYDYYLDEHRSPDDVVADLNELMRLNPKRPYYLLIHVRESNSIKRVMGIISRLDESPEVVPLDTFLKLAASRKTYETRFADTQPQP
jgi:GxGYxY sequence motif in domain of unknown function N-terminal/GxGYxYP putative glycoside hydrolase C-terminal domain